MPPLKSHLRLCVPRVPCGPILYLCYRKKKKNSLSRVPLPARRPPAVKTKSKHRRRIKRGTEDEKLCPAVEQSRSALFGLIAAPQHFGVPARRHRCHGVEIYDLPTLKQRGGAESRARQARREKIPSLNGASERRRSARLKSGDTLFTWHICWQC